MFGGDRLLHNAEFGIGHVFWYEFYWDFSLFCVVGLTIKARDFVIYTMLSIGVKWVLGMCICRFLNN